MGVNGHWYVEIEKQAFWRGAPKTFVNRYVMSGSQPAASDATTVISALKGIEDQVYPQIGAGQGYGFVQGRAYPSGKGTFFAKVDYNPSKAQASSTGYAGIQSGQTLVEIADTIEVCLIAETRLQGQSSTGKAMYLRKYFRGISGRTQGAEPGADLPPGTVAAIEGVIAPWRTGVGASNWVVIGNSGEQAAAAPTVQPFLGNHQVPRGKKRKASTKSSLLSLAQDAAKLRSLLADLPEIPALP
jgi:hypothetical protein